MSDYDKWFDTEDALYREFGVTCYVRRFDGDTVYFAVPAWRRDVPAEHTAWITQYDRENHMMYLRFTQDDDAQSGRTPKS